MIRILLDLCFAVVIFVVFLGLFLTCAKLNNFI